MNRFFKPNLTMWEGQDAFVIGGGPSLSSFDWDVLKNRNTIGCNDAYQLGSEICKVCVFGDEGWFNGIPSSRYKGHKSRLEKFTGIVVTNHPLFVSASTPSWVRVMGRQERGLAWRGDDWMLGFGFNTGIAAVNLALLFGARRVYLLGFDMDLGQTGEANWHVNEVDMPTASVYTRFLSGFFYVKRDLERYFPGREIINLTDRSKLDLFPKVSLKTFDWSPYEN